MDVLIPAVYTQWAQFNFFFNIYVTLSGTVNPNTLWSVKKGQ